MSKETDLLKLIEDLENRITDLEHVNDEKLCLAKLSESMSQTIHQIGTCKDANYIKSKDWDELRDKMIGLTITLASKINKNMIENLFKDNEDDTLYVDQKTKFFNTEPKVIEDTKKVKIV